MAKKKKIKPLGYANPVRGMPDFVDVFTYSSIERRLEDYKRVAHHVPRKQVDAYFKLLQSLDLKWDAEWEWMRSKANRKPGKLTKLPRYKEMKDLIEQADRKAKAIAKNVRTLRKAGIGGKARK